MPADSGRPASPRPSAPPPQPLTDLVRLLEHTAGPVRTLGPTGPVSVTGVTHDSRAVRPGDLYAALPGAHAHGAQFAAVAARDGAVAILTDPAGVMAASVAGLPVLVVPSPRAVLGAVSRWAFGAPADDLLMLGVTGTNGKTTTTYLIEAGLRAAGLRTGLVGTVETRIDGDAVPSVRTTPEAPDLQALFARMRECGVDAVAMEVSSHALALGRVDGTRFDVGVFTNLSQDHLDFHTTMAAYLAAKARLFSGGLAASAVVNLDDPAGAEIRARAAVPVTTFSAAGDPRADWRATDVRSGSAGTGFVLRSPDGRAQPASVRLAGAFNLSNSVAALAALGTAGVPLAAAVAGVASLVSVPGRMEPVDTGQPFLALVDYAHTPAALAALLATVRTLVRGRIIVVAGCGGDRDRDKRPAMGAAAAAGADLAVLTSDNPRSEDPTAILAAMTAGVAAVPAGRRAEVLVETDRRAAIALAVGRARPGDALVVAGKGHEQGQEVAGRRVPFDDRSELRAALLTAGSTA